MWKKCITQGNIDYYNTSFNKYWYALSNMRT